MAAYRILFKSKSGSEAARLHIFSSNESTVIKLESPYAVGDISTTVKQERTLFNKISGWANNPLLRGKTEKEIYLLKIESVINKYTDLAKHYISRLDEEERKIKEVKKIEETRTKDLDEFLMRVVRKIDSGDEE